MNGKQLTRMQARKIGESLFPGCNYLARLYSRRVQVGFPPDDKLFKLVKTAYDASVSLKMEVHYLSCEGGVGEVARDESADLAK